MTVAAPRWKRATPQPRSALRTTGAVSVTPVSRVIDSVSLPSRVMTRSWSPAVATPTGTPPADAGRRVSARQVASRTGVRKQSIDGPSGGLNQATSRSGCSRYHDVGAGPLTVIGTRATSGSSASAVLGANTGIVGVGAGVVRIVVGLDPLGEAGAADAVRCDQRQHACCGQHHDHARHREGDTAPRMLGLTDGDDVTGSTSDGTGDDHVGIGVRSAFGQPTQALPQHVHESSSA